MFYLFQNPAFYLIVPQFASSESKLEQVLRALHIYSGVRLTVLVDFTTESAEISRDDNVIHISRNFSSLSYSNIAGHLSHEYGHYILGHLTLERGISEYQEELEADIYGAIFMALNGICIHEYIEDLLTDNCDGKFYIHLEPRKRARLIQEHYDFARFNLLGAPMEVLIDYAMKEGRREALYYTKNPENYNGFPYGKLKV